MVVFVSKLHVEQSNELVKLYVLENQIGLTDMHQSIDLKQRFRSLDLKSVGLTNSCISTGNLSTLSKVQCFL